MSVRHPWKVIAATALGLATSLQDEKIPGVPSVAGSPAFFSPDGKVAALQVAFAGRPGDDLVNDAVPVVRDHATKALEGTGLQVHLVLAVFSSGYKATYDTLEELPTDTQSQEAFNILAASLPPGALSPTQVYAATLGALVIAFLHGAGFVGIDFSTPIVL